MTYTFGLDTFGDRNGDADGTPLSHAQTIRNVAEEGVFAEQAGVDFFGIGEHHTEYFPMPPATWSSPRSRPALKRSASAPPSPC